MNLKSSNLPATTYEFEPYVTHDGMILYFGSRRSPDGVSPPRQMHQWFLKNEGSVWSEPKLLGSPFFERMVMYPSVSKNKSFYFTSIGGIYYSELTDGIYKETVKLGSEINFLPLTAHSYIAADESYLIFDGQPRAEGKTDIYISYKKKMVGGPGGNPWEKKLIPENPRQSQAFLRMENAFSLQEI